MGLIGLALMLMWVLAVVGAMVATPVWLVVQLVGA